MGCKVCFPLGWEECEVHFCDWGMMCGSCTVCSEGVTGSEEIQASQELMGHCQGAAGESMKGPNVSG